MSNLKKTIILAVITDVIVMTLIFFSTIAMLDSEFPYLAICAWTAVVSGAMAYGIMSFGMEVWGV